MERDHSRFSQREKEVIELLLHGKSNKQIALELHIAQSTVEYHLKNIYNKLQVSSRTEAVLRLGQSMGDPATAESMDVTMGSEGEFAGQAAKPLSLPKIQPNKLYGGIGILLTIVVLGFLFYRYQSAQSPCGPQDIAVPARLNTPTGLIGPETTNMSWPDQIVYVLNPAHTGTNLAGIRQQMSHLKGLGITSVLLGPIFSDQDFRKVDPRWGTKEELVALIEELHSTDNGPRINVILKLTMATTAQGHEWFIHPELYPRHYRVWNADQQSDNLANEPLSETRPFDHVFFQPLLNHTHGIYTRTGTYQDVQETIFWLVDEFDFDGFQYAGADLFCPAFWPVFLSDFRERYDQTKPDFWHIAEVFILHQESWQIPYQDFVKQTSAVGPIAMDGADDFPLRSFLQDISIRGVDPNCVSPFCIPLQNHLISPDGLQNPERLTVSIDQLGETFVQAVKKAEKEGALMERLRLASVLLMTVNRVPLIQSGNEYGFSEELDPTFREFFKKLIQIRRDHPAFRRSSLIWLETTERVISYARQDVDQTFIVVLNLDTNPKPDFEIHLGAQGVSCSRGMNILVDSNQSIQPRDNSLFVTLDPWEPQVIQCE